MSAMVLPCRDHPVNREWADAARAGLVCSRRDGRMAFYLLAGGFPRSQLEHCLRQLLTTAKPERDDARP